jgi:hypothetical protein
MYMAMHRTTILLPVDLRASAEAHARRQGISLGELIRRQLKRVAKSKKAKSRRDDPVFRYHLGRHHKNVKDTVTDGVLNHDKYIAEALEAEVRRWR